MELEALKMSWDRLDKKIQHATLFNEKLVEHIVSSKVTTTVDKIKRLYTSFYAVLSTEMIFIVAVFIGNPFDFKYKLQYVPFALLFICVGFAFVNLINIHKAIRNISPGTRIDHYITGIVSICNRNQRFEKWFGIIFFSVGLLIPVSFLPQKIERLGMSKGIADLGISLGIVLILYFVAYKVGAFKSPYKEKLQKHLEEWNELQSLAKKIEG
jgi:hypothetical protein